MAKEIVKYHNDLNTISSMRGWTGAELNIFFGIIAKIRDKGTKEIVLNTDELKEITDTVGNKNKQRWEDAVEAVADKIASIRYYYRDENRRTIMNLFAYFDVDIHKKKLTVAVTDRFEYIINQLTVQFTTWELVEFTSLKSSYAKTMYRLLKQWRTLGTKEFTIEEFKTLFDIPDSYSMGMIKKRVVEQSIKELGPYFKRIRYKSIKSNKQGNPVIAYEFTWEAEQIGTYNPNKYQKKSRKKKTEIIPYWATNSTKKSSEVVEKNQEIDTERQLKNKLNTIFSDEKKNTMD